jgi:hypothetical protein
MGKSSSRFACAEVQKYLPQDLLSKVTILLQDSGYVTISRREKSSMRPRSNFWLTGSDWDRLDERVKQMGGLWISDGRFSHWSIPFSRAN